MRAGPVPGAREFGAHVVLLAVRTFDCHMLHTARAAAAAEHHPVGVAPYPVQNLEVAGHERSFVQRTPARQAGEDEHSANAADGVATLTPAAAVDVSRGCVSPSRGCWFRPPPMSEPSSKGPQANAPPEPERAAWRSIAEQIKSPGFSNSSTRWALCYRAARS